MASSLTLGDKTEQEVTQKYNEASFRVSGSRVKRYQIDHQGLLPPTWIVIMKCQQCQKQSTFQITEILPEQDFEELHLCDECAQKYFIAVTPKKKKLTPVSDPLIDKQCQHCGTKFVDFRNSGRLGCPHDYEVFITELVPLLENIHSNIRHVGKTPQRRPNHKRRQQELTRLKQELQQAIDKEAYEAAARIRDQLRTLERE